jgi:hypothetical protein
MEDITDLLVDNRLIIELMAAKALADEHVAQILTELQEARTWFSLPPPRLCGSFA